MKGLDAIVWDSLDTEYVKFKTGIAVALGLNT